MWRFILSAFLFFFWSVAVFAAAPVVEGTSTHVFSATGESITMPSGIVSGELLVAVVATADVTTLSASGWTEVYNTSRASTITTAILTKTAAGSDTMTLTVSPDKQGTAIVMRVSGADTASLEATSANGKSTSADGPSHTPTGGSDDYLYLALAGIDRSGTCSAGPSGYSGFISNGSGSGASAGTCMAYKATTASSSENPGAFTNSSFDWIVWTASIAPSGGGTPTPTPSVTNWLMVVE